MPTQKGRDTGMGKHPDPSLPAGGFSSCCCRPLLPPSAARLGGRLHSQLATLPGEPAISHGLGTRLSVSQAACRLLCQFDGPPLKIFMCAGKEGSVGSFIRRDSSLCAGRFDAGQPSHRSRTTSSPDEEPDPTALAAQRSSGGDTCKCLELRVWCGPSPTPPCRPT